MHLRWLEIPRVRRAALVCACIFVAALPCGAVAQSTSIADRQAQLQAQLNALDAQIQAYQSNLAGAQKQQTSLERDLEILDDQIQAAKLAIERRTLTIQQISASIQQAEDTISGLNDQLQNEYESLAAILRETDQLDTTSVVVAALTSQSLSDFFADIDQFNAIDEAMQSSFTAIQTNKQANEQQKADLENQLSEEEQLRTVQQLQQQQIQQQEDQKNQILAATKGQETAYQKLITTTQQSAAQIRAALFDLTGTKAIPFEQALQYANLAEKQTGIRPAFLLGVITEESNLGQNVGTGTFDVDAYNCYLNLGEPTNAAKQKSAFDAITSSLGLDPNAMPVSKKPWYGCGGAMGPAQFIPSTWALYAGYSAPSWTYDPAKDRVGKSTGNRPPNPWNPVDAFMAASLYLTDSGAAQQTPAAEFKAAMCYLAGCGNANNRDLQFYGNQVSSLAAKYQQEINIINGS